MQVDKMFVMLFMRGGMLLSSRAKIQTTKTLVLQGRKYVLMGRIFRLFDEKLKSTYKK